MDNNVVEMNILDGNSISIFAQNKEDKYVIPLYQRAFAWSEKEIVQLIDDILDIDDGNENYYLGSLIVANQKDYYEVIDGQQRLTALYLLLNSLGIETENALSFACREKSNYTLKNIKEVVDSQKVSLLDEEKLEGTLLEGIHIIERKLLSPDVCKEKIIENLHRVKLYRIQVPERTDLNRYFEIMNTRGEQLEQHDILKATLMSFLANEDERELFALIWNAVSDMTGYVQMHFDVPTRKALFDYDWNQMPDIKRISTDKKFGAHSSYSISDISKIEFCIEENEGKNDDVDRVRFESIIDFPYFLLHALRVFIKKYKIEAISDDVKLVDELLDDKKLTTAFDKVIKYGSRNGAIINKHDFALQFISDLLQERYLFDKYFIKREYTNDSLDGEWSLKELRVSYTGKNGRAYYANTPLKKYKEWESTYAPRTKTNLMLQSCLRVSYTSPKVMHWITELMWWLCEDRYVNLSKLDKYQEATEQIAKRAVVDQFLSFEDYNQGVNTPHIVFNYLDYLLWAKDKTQSSFVFEFRNSVEHWYPRNPSEGTFEQWTHDEGVDRFGNLCIIQRNVNSKFSNMAPEAKKTTFRDMISKGSLKLKIMAEKTIASGTLSASHIWKDTAFETHEQEMIQILKNACVDLLPSSSQLDGEIQ